ncbi:hypothetical protein B296_00014007 [Ensete ventricosum]|uniref:Uncharacterized protein n=1 Tax=Ensete ventricosum TaxID=4639 RepID=A0A427ACC0_ENSVE|nr:hypothetical protein B296_00014007 [Ensete ventricosum]
MGDLIIQRYDWSGWRAGLPRCSHSLREPSKSEDKFEYVNVATKEAKENIIGDEPYNKKVDVMHESCSLSTDHDERDVDAKQQIVGPWLGKAPWYRRGGTSVESSIPCSYRWRALVMKGAEEVENTEANSKYYDKAEGQRPRNFIRPVSTSF